MSGKRILHLCPDDIKFIPSFISFVKENFDSAEHLFLITNDKKNPTRITDALYVHDKAKLLSLIKEMNKADKIILHSILNRNTVKLLALQPWLLKKCYWIMWGADLYYYQNRPHNLKWNLYEKVRAFVIKRIGHFITQIRGDYELACKWYHATGQYHNCVMYPTNLYQEFTNEPPSHDGVHILVGNSASQSNNHSAAFKILEKYKNDNIKIFCPLSYGDPKYAAEITHEGKNLFGDKFTALTAFMSLHEYTNFLNSIDIGIFNYDRQQGIGNITTLINLEKKIYLKKDTTTWKTFQDNGITAFDINNFELSPIERNISLKNKEQIKSIYSKENLKSQLQKIWNA